MKKTSPLGSLLIFFGVSFLFAGIVITEGLDPSTTPIFRLLKKAQAGALTKEDLQQGMGDIKLTDMHVLKRVLVEKEEFELAAVVRDEIARKEQVK